MIAQMTQTIMKNKYYLKNPFVIKYISNNVPCQEISEYDHRGHEENLRNLCKGDVQELNNALWCLEDKTKRK